MLGQLHFSKVAFANGLEEFVLAHVDLIPRWSGGGGRGTATATASGPVRVPGRGGGAMVVSVRGGRTGTAVAMTAVTVTVAAGMKTCVTHIPMLQTCIVDCLNYMYA